MGSRRANVTSLLVLLGAAYACAAHSPTIGMDPACITRGQERAAALDEAEALRRDTTVAMRALWTDWKLARVTAPPRLLADESACRQAAAAAAAQLETPVAAVALVRLGPLFVVQPAHRFDHTLVLDGRFKLLADFGACE